ncbi:hypothetical protein IKD67_04270 [Candidatus Saccharibacteria bacterium]|nr:hypothetical protein [Candidatus Saccharibacteria bacterium]
MIDFIKKHLGVILIIGITIIALVLRYKMRDFQTNDFINCLNNWYEYLKTNGLRNTFAGGGIGDYNCPYIILLWVLTKLPISSLFAIKIVSVIFDFGLAIMAALVAKRIMKEKKQDSKKTSFATIITYSIIILLPTVMFNSALWAQCDAIYAFFVITSIYFLLGKKYSLSFIMLGCAFAFKLQFIFVLPIYLLIYLKNKEFSILNFLWIPAMLIILSIPAFMCGLPFMKVFETYFLQVGEYKYLTLNMFNIYQVFDGAYEYMSLVGYSVCVIIFSVLFYYVIRFYKKVEPHQIITMMLLSVLVCICFLPSMHERYAYVAVILGVIYYAIGNGTALIFVGIEGISLLGYCAYLFELPVSDYRLLGLVPLAVIVYLSRQIKSGATENTVRNRIKNRLL